MPGLVMTIAVFMILNQLHIAESIVTITFAALIGSVAFGAALAFGLGGRDVASRMLEDAYRKGHEQRGNVRRDVETGRDRAQDQAEEAKDKVAKDGSGQLHGAYGT